MTTSIHRNVLILDDDRAIGDVLARLVHCLGATATAVARIDDAHRQLRSARWDAILLDLHLAEGNALDLMPTIQQASDLPPIILISGNATPKAVARAMRGPAVDFLQKPFDLADVASALERVWTRRVLADPCQHGVAPLLREAISLIAGIESGALGAADARASIEASPLLTAARTFQAERWGSGPGRVPQASADLFTDAVGAEYLGAAMLATAWSIEGPCRLVATTRAEVALEHAARCRDEGKRIGLDEDTVELAALLHGVPAIALAASAAKLPGSIAEHGDLCARIDAHAPTLRARMLRSWGLPESVARRTGVADGDGVPSAVAGLVRWADRSPESTGPAQPRVGSSLEDALVSVLRHRRARWVLPLQGAWPGSARVVSGLRQATVQLVDMAADHASVRFLGDDRELVSELADRTRIEGLWLEVEEPGGGATAQVPIEFTRVQQSPPFEAELKLVGAPHHRERVKALTLRVINKRRAVRLPADGRNPVTVRVVSTSGNVSLEAVIGDLSMNGLGLLFRTEDQTQLTDGLPVTLTVPLPDGGPPVPLAATVAYVRVEAGVDPVTREAFSVLHAGIAIDPLSLGRPSLRQRWTAWVMVRQRTVLRESNARRG